jgi:hypothetical protein
MLSNFFSMKILRMRFRARQTIMALGLAGLALSCADCLPVPGTQAVVAVKVYSYDSLVLAGRRVLLSDSLAAAWLEGSADTLFADTLANAFGWPLPIAEEAQLVLEWARRAPDTVKVSYSRSLRPVPPDCGAYEVYEGLALLGSTADSAHIFKERLEVGDTLHLEIFTDSLP